MGPMVIAPQNGSHTIVSPFVNTEKMVPLW